jgi:hypothetical protein
MVLVYYKPLSTYQTSEAKMSNIQILFLCEIKYSSSLLFSGEVFTDETRISHDSFVESSHGNNVAHNEKKVCKEHVRSRCKVTSIGN